MTIQQTKILNVMKELELQDTEERKRGLPAKERLRSIEPATGALLKSLILIQKPNSILEIGTSAGYSTLWLVWAAALIGAHVWTCEIDTKKIQLASKNFQKAAISDYITIIEGDARITLIKKPNLPEKWDFIFIDAEKRDYLHLFKVVEPHTHTGTVVTAHNVISHKNELKDFLEHMIRLKNWHTEIIPLEKGTSISIRLR